MPKDKMKKEVKTKTYEKSKPTSGPKVMSGKTKGMTPSRARTKKC